MQNYNLLLNDSCVCLVSERELEEMTRQQEKERQVLQRQKHEKELARRRIFEEQVRKLKKMKEQIEGTFV